MILDARGNPVVKKTTETTLTPEVISMLTRLEPVLKDLGIGLRCFKCEALGLIPHMYGDNAPGDAVYRLICSCATRECHEAGKVKVYVN